jgi:hypothetical protein
MKGRIMTDGSRSASRRKGRERKPDAVTEASEFVGREDGGRAAGMDGCGAKAREVRSDA